MREKFNISGSADRGLLRIAARHLAAIGLRFELDLSGEQLSYEPIIYFGDVEISESSIIGLLCADMYPPEAEHIAQGMFGQLRTHGHLHTACDCFCPMEIIDLTEGAESYMFPSEHIGVECPAGSDNEVGDSMGQLLKRLYDYATQHGQL